MTQLICRNGILKHKFQQFIGLINAVQIYCRVGSTHWAFSNHASDLWHHISTWNLKALGLLALSRICCQPLLFYPMWDNSHLIYLNISPQVWVSLHLGSIITLLLLLHQVESDFDTTVESWGGVSLGWINTLNLEPPDNWLLIPHFHQKP
jgi:hypothetical protein